MPQQNMFDQPDFGDVQGPDQKWAPGGGGPPSYNPPGFGPGGGSAGSGFFGLQANIPDFGYGPRWGRKRLFGMMPSALQMRGQPSMLGQGMGMGAPGGGGMGRMGGGGMGLEGGGGWGPQRGPMPGAAPSGSPYGQTAFDPAFAYNNGQFSGGQLQNNLMMLAGRGGAFDPYGSEGLLNMIRGDLTSQYQRDLPALIQRARTQASLDSGGDPLLRGYAGTMAGIGAQNSYSSALLSALGGARERLGTGAQDWLRQLTGNYFGGAINRRDPRKQGMGMGLGANVGGKNYGVSF